jgi:kynurenine formamidase
VVIDVVGQKGVAKLADDYRISREDLEAALRAQGTSLQAGDIVLIKGGKITLDASKWLAEGHGAMLIGGDELSLELYKVGRPDLTVPVHNYLINERGLAILQVENIDVLVADKVYEFAFIAAPLRSTSGVVQFRPLAFPLK